MILQAVQRHFLVVGLVSALVLAVPGGAVGATRESIEEHLYWARYAEAEVEARELLAETEGSYGPDSLEAALAMDLVVDALVELWLTKDGEALRLAERAVAIKESLLGSEHFEVARSLFHQARALNRMGLYSEQAATLVQAIAVAGNNPEKSPIEVADFYLDLAHALLFSGDYMGAESNGQKAFEIRTAHLGSDSPVTIDAFHVLAIAGGFLGGDDQGALFEASVVKRRESLGSDHPLVARSLEQYADWLSERFETGASISAYERSVAIFERSLGPQHPRTAETKVYLAQGLLLRDLTRAQEMLLEAQNVFEEKIGSGSYWAVTAKVNIASVWEEEGDFVAARRLLEDIIASPDQPFRGNWMFESISSFRLAMICRHLGDFESASGFYEQAILAMTRGTGPHHQYLLEIKATYAEFLTEIGDYTKAKSIAEEYFDFLRKSHVSRTTGSVPLFLALGRITADSGECDTGRGYFDRGLALLEPGHRGQSDFECWFELMMSRTALDLECAGPSEALPGLQEAIRVLSGSVGWDHVDMGRCQSLYGRALLANHEYSKAFDAAIRAEAVGRLSFFRNGRGLTEREALMHAATRPVGLGLVISLAAHGYGDGLRTWEALLRSRSLVLDEMAARHRLAIEYRDTELAVLQSEVTDARARLARLFVAGPSPEMPLVHEVALEEARVQKETAERQLAERSAVFRQEIELGATGFEDVARALPREAALVAYARYDDYLAKMAPDHQGPPPPTVPSYAAFVLPAGGQEPVVVALGPAEPIDRLVARLRDHLAVVALDPNRISAAAESAYRETGEALRAAIWDPVARVLGDSETVFVVLDGSLHHLSLAALPVGPRSYIAETGPLIHYLTTERDILSLTEPGVGEGLLALGDPAFDAADLPSPRFALALGGLEESAEVVSGVPVYRGGRSSCSRFRQLRFERLPASGREVAAIASMWRSAHPADGEDGVEGMAGSRVAALRGVSATEDVFKAAASQMGTLHLATHGFFVGDACAPAGDETSRSAETFENPLLLSGLALAGANHRASAPLDRDDGILTAEEIAAMDLTGVHWAVLSACDTGAGFVREGEGVFGLRRAFQIAGARTLIMSLWSVDDESTGRWMRALYRARLERDLSTAESVRAASLELLSERRESGESTHPFFWAGFVATGDWR